MPWWNPLGEIEVPAELLSPSGPGSKYRLAESCENTVRVGPCERFHARRPRGNPNRHPQRQMSDAAYRLSAISTK